jgi:hypothetical protein
MNRFGAGYRPLGRASSQPLNKLSDSEDEKNAGTTT